MKLKDLYFADKHKAGYAMSILLPDGQDSGETLQIIGADCEAGVRAARNYAAGLRAAQNDLYELNAKCKERDDWTEYNEQLEYRGEELNLVLAASVIIGWSFDDELTEESKYELLRQYRALPKMVVDEFAKSRERLLGK